MEEMSSNASNAFNASNNKNVKTKFNEFYVDQDGTKYNHVSCTPPKEYAKMEDDPRGRKIIYNMAMQYRNIPDYKRKTWEVKNHLCSSKTPYLDDNGYCCSPFSDKSDNYKGHLRNKTKRRGSKGSKKKLSKGKHYKKKVPKEYSK